MSNWLVLPETAGVTAAELESTLASQKEQKLVSATIDKNEEEGVRTLSPKLTDGELDLNDELLERLRTMCQLWEVDIKPSQITSHRPVIGPVIVAVKKALYPIIRLFLKDMIIQQRSFNAATIRFVAGLSEKGRS